MITSETRIKLLLKFFLNSRYSSYLRELEQEFHESTNAIRLELNRFEKAGLLKSYAAGNKKMFRANVAHPLYPEINSLIMKHVGLDQVLERVVKQIGGLEKAFIAGSFANGNDSDVIDLVFVGDTINKTFLISLIEKAEQVINRKIRYLIYTIGEYGIRQEEIANKSLLIWNNMEEMKVKP